MGEKGNALPSGDPASEAAPMETRSSPQLSPGNYITERSSAETPTGDPTGGPGIADQAAGGGLTSYRARDPDQPGISIVAYEWDLNNDRSGELAPEQAKRDREVGG